MSSSSNLLTLIIDAFSKEEIRNMCYELGLDYEEFPDAKSGLVREMLVLCEKTDRLKEVVDICRRERPKQIWPDPSKLLTRKVLLGESLELVVPYEPETVEIPAGDFLMGSPLIDGIPEAEQPQHSVTLPRFRIGRYPVTNKEYDAFISQTGRIVSPESGWPGQSPDGDKLYHPVEGVTFFEALIYCQWLSEQTGRTYRVPSEAEWEKAARGEDGRIYPWGNTWVAIRCHFKAESSAAVDAYPAQNEIGCYDMIGNIREWTCTIWGEKRREPDKRYRYPWVDDGRNDIEAGVHLRRVYRGGGYDDPRDRLRCSSRDGYSPDKPGPPGRRHGFRIVLEID